jgi:PAS domain S-box-containing protein
MEKADAATEQRSAADFRFGHLFHRIRDAVIVADAKTERMVLWNPGATRLFGYTEEEALAMPLHLLVPDELRADHRAGIQRYHRTHQGVRVDSDQVIDVNALHKTGKRIPVEITLSRLPIYLDTEDRFVMAIIRDASFRKALEETRIRERTAVMFEQSPLAMTIVDATGRLLDANPAFQSLSGYSLAELCTMSPFDITHAEDRELSRRSFEQLVAGSLTRQFLEKRYVTKTGSVVWGRLVTFRLVSSDGAPPVFMAMIQDITQEKQLSAQLIQSQRMEAVGLVAGGVAHDFNNLLTTIVGHSELILASEELDPSVQEGIHGIHEAASIAEEISDQLLQLTGRRGIETGVVSLRDLLLRLEGVVRSAAGENVSVEMTLDGTPCWVRSDAGPLEQVVLNLCMNAKDAMVSRGGSLLVALDTVDLTERGAGALLGMSEGRHVRLRIEDTGAGISTDAQPHIFEPFFSTKPRGETSGLGLSTVYQIVAALGGSITFKSTLGEGTAFEVHIPLASPPSETPPGTPAGGGGRNILLVDDQDGVRLVVARMLGRLGYRVIQAASGDEALQVHSSGADSIDVLVTDVVMPGLDGADLARRVTSSRPDLPVLFISGHSDVLPHIPDRPGRTALLNKPIHMDELGRALDHIVGSRSGGKA